MIARFERHRHGGSDRVEVDIGGARQQRRFVGQACRTVPIPASMLPILLEYVRSGGGFSTSAVELFENVFVSICTDQELSELEGCTQRFLLRICVRAMTGSLGSSRTTLQWIFVTVAYLCSSTFDAIA